MKLSSPNSSTRPQKCVLGLPIVSDGSSHSQGSSREFGRDEDILPRDTRFVNVLSQVFLRAYIQYSLIGENTASPYMTREPDCICLPVPPAATLDKNISQRCDVTDRHHPRPAGFDRTDCSVDPPYTVLGRHAPVPLSGLEQFSEIWRS